MLNMTILNPIWLAPEPTRTVTCANRRVGVSQ